MASPHPIEWPGTRLIPMPRVRWCPGHREAGDGGSLHSAPGLSMCALPLAWGDPCPAHREDVSGMGALETLIMCPLDVHGLGCGVSELRRRLLSAVCVRSRAVWGGRPTFPARKGSVSGLRGRFVPVSWLVIPISRPEGPGSVSWLEGPSSVSWPGVARPPTTCGPGSGKVVGGRATPGHDTEITSHDTEITSHDTEITSHDTGIPSHDTGIPSHDIEITSHDTEIPSHDIEITSHDTGIPNHDTELPGHDTQLGPSGNDTELWPSGHGTTITRPNHCAGYAAAGRRLGYEHPDHAEYRSLVYDRGCEICRPLSPTAHPRPASARRSRTGALAVGITPPGWSRQAAPPRRRRTGIVACLRRRSSLSPPTPRRFAGSRSSRTP